MIVIETCPICNHDLVDIVIATYPPIHQKQCFNCGWSFTDEVEKVVRVPFDVPTTTLNTHDWSNNDTLVSNACDNCPNNPKNGGSGYCNCTLGTIPVIC